MMTILPQPTTQLQEVLCELILNDTISVRQILSDTGILNPKARISDLRRIGVNIETEMVHVTNKYGRKAKFGQWSIPEESKQSATEMYLKMSNDEQ